MGDVFIRIRGTAEVPELSADPVADRDWRERSKCIDAVPELFFPRFPWENGGKRDLVTVHEAKAFCNGDSEKYPGVCPVRHQCAVFAIKLKINDGVWGGMSERERKRYAGRLRKFKKL